MSDTVKHYAVSKGLLPRTNRRVTSDAVLEKAINVDIRHGDLRPWPCPALECKHEFEVKTIINTDLCECVAFDECIDFVYLPMGQSRHCQFMMWIDPELGPRIASIPDFCQGESCSLGVDCPPPPEIISSQPAEQGCDCGYTAYTVTYIDKYFREGPPSAPTETIVSPVTGQVCITLPQPTDPCVTHIRIYKAFKPWKEGSEEETTLDSGWHRVTDIPVGATQYCDQGVLAAADIPLSTTTWMPPPDNLEGLALLRNGVLVGWEGQKMYFTDPMTTQGWTRRRDILIDHNIKQIIPHGNIFYVLTDGNPYHVSIKLNEDGYWYDWRMIEEKLPLIAQKGWTKNQDGVFYVSTNGLVMLSQTRDGIRASMMSRQWWLPDDWCKIDPETACLAAYDGLVFLFTSVSGWIFQYPNEYWGETGHLTEYNKIRPTACYCTEDGELWLAEGKQVYRWRPCSDPDGPCETCCPYEVKLRLAFRRSHSRWGAFRMWLRNGDVEFKYRRADCDGPCDWDKCKIDHCEPYWLKSQGRGHDYEIELCGCGIVEGFSIGNTKRSLTGTPAT